MNIQMLQLDEQLKEATAAKEAAETERVRGLVLSSSGHELNRM